MRKKYEKLLDEITEITSKSYALAEVLQGYCDNFDGEKVSSIIISDFFKEIKEKQLEIIRLIDKKSTEIGHESLTGQDLFCNK